jgi:murein DD-endopeptidase MepM/ murein hydrolase activator NlpD
MVLRVLICCVLFISCSKKTEYKKPNFISFKLENDSIYVNIENRANFPTFIKIIDDLNKKEEFIDFKKGKDSIVLKFSQSKIDTNSILENYKFYYFHGPSNIKRYDTLYNYGLPFLKGKRYRVLQGNNGGFSHNKITSKYALDFKMNIGQKVCAIRDGIVITTKDHFTKNGTSDKYLNKANLILVRHSDGTYVQYAHFKKNGVLVKKGDTIKKGQVIGYSGNTGYSSEPHLHFTIYKPTKNGLISIPFILDSIASKKYKRGKYATNK